MGFLRRWISMSSGQGDWVERGRKLIDEFANTLFGENEHWEPQHHAAGLAAVRGDLNNERTSA
jgi:hypothetical protein